MGDVVASCPEDEPLHDAIKALRTVGVVGGGADNDFSATGSENSREALERRLREGGYAGGRLAIRTLLHPHDGVDLLIYDTGRFGEPTEAERAWEQDYRSRWHATVERRVDDWVRRLSDLRVQMSDWIAESPEFSTLQIVDLPPTVMSEEMMRTFDVPPAHMPVFELHAGSRRVMRFQPKGLWVIGANGRVDLITKSDAPILVDQSEPNSGSSDWQMHYSRGRENLVPFNKHSFSDLLRSAL